MSDIATALTPILVLILLGYGLKQSRFLPEDTWSGIEKLTYFILFPALLVRTLGNQSLVGSPWTAMLLVIVGVLIIVTALLTAWHLLRPTVSGATFTSIFQGGVRFNTYISLAVAQAYFGSDGLAMGAIAAGFMIVLINVLCVSVFAIWGNNSKTGIKPLLRDVIGNPLIVACVLGWFLSLTGIGIPGVAEDIFEIIGRTALPFGLLAVGAALKPEAIRGHIVPIAVSSVTQFGLKPLAAALLISVTGLSGVPAGALIICLMVPTASSAYILSRQLGGDTAAMASIITFQTLLAFLAMPLISVIML